MRILFIHRSVGQQLINHGQLRQLLNSKDIELDDYDNNDGILTHNDDSKDKNLIQIPGDNTNPNNLADYFSHWDSLLDRYDLIIIKSCYPNSHIRTPGQLEQIKKQYDQIIEAFIKHKQQLLIMTTPPLRKLFTNHQETQLADELAAGLMSRANEQIHVFDFRKLLTGPNGTLNRQYCHKLRLWDNHPNPKAHKFIAPKLTDYITSLKKDA